MIKTLNSKNIFLNCFSIIFIAFIQLKTTSAAENGVVTKNFLLKEKCDEKLALWVKYSEKQFGCIFYYAGGVKSNNKTIIVFIPGDVNPELQYLDLLPEKLLKSVSFISERTKYPFMYLTRPGLMGSTGDYHFLYHTEAEVNIINSALDEIKMRFGVGKFVLVGQSAGGLIVSGILTRRTDIGCAVISSGLLSIVDFADQTKISSVRARRELERAYNPINHIDELKKPVPPLYFIADPEDVVVPIKGQRHYYDTIRSKNINAEWIEMQSRDPNHHILEGRAILGAARCAGN